MRFVNISYNKTNRLLIELFPALTCVFARDQGLLHDAELLSELFMDCSYGIMQKSIVLHCILSDALVKRLAVNRV